MTTAIGEHGVELQIGGMTCASCAARIEKKLNRMEGVTATVNYATERAKVTLAEGSGVGTADLIATVEKTGYTAVLPGRRPPPRLLHNAPAARPAARRTARTKQRARPAVPPTRSPRSANGC